MRANAIYAVIAVMVCLIAPIATGFLWPVDSDTVTSWETNGESTSLTETFETTDIPGTIAYSGVNNNLYGRMGPSFWTGPTPNAYTTIDSAYATYTTDYTPISVTMTAGTHVMGPSDMQDIYDTVASELATQNKTNLGYIEINDSNPEPKMWTFDGYYELESYMYYPTGLAQGVIKTTVPDVGGNVVDLTNKDIILYVESVLLVTPMFYPVEDGARQYADVKQGFEVPNNETFTWVNGYSNHSIDIVIRVPDATTHLGGIHYYFQWATGYYGGYIEIDPDNMIYLHTSMGTYTLGNREAYSYVLLRIDADNDRVQLYGLVAYTGFTTPQSSNLGNMVQSAIYGGLEPFRWLTFSTISEPVAMDYFVSSTLSETYTFKGIVDATVTPNSYYPDSYWMLRISNPALFGSSLSFTGSETTTYPITNGTVTLPMKETRRGVETIVNKEIPVRDITITHVVDGDTPRVFINGAEYGGDANITTVGFNGGWVATFTLYDVDAYKKPIYVWEGGGFGLDTTGFCGVGIIAALCCFTLFGFLYRSQGDWGTILGMAVSVVCGALYVLIALQ